MASLINMSGGSLLMKGLPYDAEIEYLRATGTQYIDTGIKVDSYLSVMFRARCSVNANLSFCGAIATSPVRRHHSNASSAYWYETNLNIPFVSNKWVDFTIDTENKIVTIDTRSVPITVTEWSINANYGIFGRLSDTGLVQTIRDGNVDFVSMRLWRNNVILRDYVPVRIGQTGYMYDKVSKQLFGNSGTGDFILGNDI